MRIDKWLKVTRIIKRRSIAQLACAENKVLLNDKIAKPSSTIKVGDLIQITFGNNSYTYKVLKAELSNPKANEALNWFEIN